MRSSSARACSNVISSLTSGCLRPGRRTRRPRARRRPAPGDERRGRAEDLAFPADDRIAALERRRRRERAETAGEDVQAPAGALDEQGGRAGEPHVVPGEVLPGSLDPAAGVALEASRELGEPSRQLRPVGDDEPRRGRRRRGPRVGDEVAERRVLLVPDGRDDRSGALGDRAHEPLVAERQEIVEAAAAAGEDDDVAPRPSRGAGERPQSRAAPAAPAPRSRRRGCGPAGSARGSA